MFLEFVLLALFVSYITPMNTCSWIFRFNLSRRRHMKATLICFFMALYQPAPQAQTWIPLDGLTTSHDYSQSPIDSVDLDSGNLMIDIPIISYKQRGSLSDFVLKVRYNTPGWGVMDDERNVVLSNWIITDPSPTDLSNAIENFPGWVFYGKGMQVIRGDGVIQGLSQTSIEQSNGEEGLYNEAIVQDSTGTPHLMYLQNDSGQVRAMDGSGFQEVSFSSNVFDAKGIKHTGADTGSSDGFADTISDPFGNTITPVTSIIPGTNNILTQVDHWLDSIGRVIPAPHNGVRLVTPGCYPLEYPSTSNTTSTYTFCYATINGSSSFNAGVIAEASVHFPFLTSVQLPNGKAYTFIYNSWGEIGRIGLPSGGSVTYTWATAAAGSQSGRRLFQRTLDPADGTPVRVWTYCFTSLVPGCQSLPAGISSMIDPDGNETWRHVSDALSISSSSRTTVNYQGAAASGVILKSVQTFYCNAASVFGRGPLPDPLLVCQTTTTLSDGELVVEKTTYDTPTSVGDPIGNFDISGISESGSGFKSMGLPVLQTVSNFAASTSATSTVKSTATQYLWQTNPNYLASNFLDLPSSRSISDGTPTMFAKTIYAYDEGNGSPQGIYGDCTSITQWQNSSTGPTPKSSTVYNAQGMVSDEYDGNTNAQLAGDHMSVAYDSTGLYPKSITHSATGIANHVDYYSYDTNMSSLNLHTDQNGTSAGDTQHTTVWTYDNLGRAISVSYPGGGGSSFCFTDVGGSGCSQTAAPYSAYTMTRLASGVSMTSIVSYNGLGQVTSQVAPSGAVVATTYDLVGRVGSVSNPYIGSGSPSQWTTFLYNALGQKTQATFPDSSVQTWDYYGNSVTFTDEASRRWTRSSDSLGRLVSVSENANGTGSVVSCGLPCRQRQQLVPLQTNYTYDVLNNLVDVTQLGQPGGDIARIRHFTYDSLSRLLSSTNPETGTINYNAYDPNGNLRLKTDANGTTMQYNYDGLNRLINKSSSNVASPDDNAVFTYDTCPNGIGRLCLESVANGSGTTFSYDSMGRVAGTDWFNYAARSWQPGMAVLYDLAGNIKQLTYPDGRVVQQAWDGAGRLSGVTDTTTGAGGPAYFGTTQYYPSGALQSATLGNGVSEVFTLNTRLQPCRSAASTPLLAAVSDPSGGNLYDRQSFYNAAANLPCGNEANNNGNVYGIVDNLAATAQGFQYDGLNRLTSATRASGSFAYSHTYNYDSFGNMLLHDNVNYNLNYSIDPATNRLLLNGSDLQYNSDGSLASSPAMSYGYTPEGHLRSINNFANGSYLYNGTGERTLAVHNSNTSGLVWNEYVYLNGQPMADVDNNGNWTDTIYANGEKIAKVNSLDAPIHISGDNCYNCGGTASYISLSSGAGHVIQPGDALHLTQYNAGDSVGGLILRFADGSQTSGLVARDQNGQPINCDAVTNQLHNRHIDLSAYAGETLASTLVINDVCSPGGHFDQYFNDIAIIGSTGQVTSIYSPQPGATYTMIDATAAWPGPVSNMRAVAEPNTYAPNPSTHYYLDDHLGTTQMELSSGGWPVWQGAFTPFGQEIIAGATTNYLGQQPQDGTAMRYKFTGKERDAESGLDYFGARYYASNMGRWMSPDWADKPEAVPYSSLDDPQSLNLYGYVYNNPLSRADADGHWPDWDSTAGQLLVGVGKAIYNATVVPASALINGVGHLTAPNAMSGAHSSSLAATNDDQAAGMKVGDKAMVMSVVFTGPAGAAPEVIEEGAAGAGAARASMVREAPAVPDSIPAGPSARPTAAQQQAINEMGNANGCHECGAPSSGRPSGNWTGDHIPPTSQNPPGGAQVYKPHCATCSARQGARVAQENRAARAAASAAAQKEHQ